MAPSGGAGRAGSRAMVVDLQHPGDAALFRCCYRLRAAPQLPSPESLAGSPRSSVGGGAAKGNDILVREVREVLLSYESTRTRIASKDLSLWSGSVTRGALARALDLSYESCEQEVPRFRV